MYTTIGELGPKIPYYRRNYGPNSLMVVYVDPLGGRGFRASEARGGALLSRVVHYIDM